MVLIYCIEDINDLKYVGSTTQKLCKRMATHRQRKSCSSSKLNLYNCIYYVLEECSQDVRKERERYWINKLECVNDKKLNGRDEVKRVEYYKQRKEITREYYKEYYKTKKKKKK